MAETSTTPQVDQLEINTVKLWTKRIKAAKKFFEKDFARMKENMEFAAGLQRAGQTTIDSGAEYICNFVNHEVNTKVAALYARDPKAVARRRKRLDFEHWDGEISSEWAATKAVAQGQQKLMQTGVPDPSALMAQQLLKDIETGKAMRQLLERIGRTMEYVYSYECDSQAPSFKYQMKQLVRRVVTTGVGFVRLNFSRLGDSCLSQTGTDDSISMREKRAALIEELDKAGDLTEDDPRHQQLEQLEESLAASEAQGDEQNLEERLEFDFPPSTRIIVDSRCTSLKGFIGARWIAQEYDLPIETANAYFETNIKAGGELVTYSENGVEHIKSDPSDGSDKDPQEKPICRLWEVFDLTTKSSFFIADGWKEWVEAPKPVAPAIGRFWPVFALTFNDVEVEGNCKVHVYPPSDVELMKHAQKEYNRQREELRKHRQNNRPWYLTVAGWLTDEDIEKFGSHETSEVVQVKGMPPGGDLAKAVQKFESAPIDANLYNTQAVLEDVGHAIGSNQQLQQQNQRHVAATPAVIAEQSRMSGVNSNVDDLDDLLSELARASGEMMLREFSLETVKRIAGRGAVWPERNQEDFLNMLYLDIVASSSGRPNKAVEIANFERIAPIMMQAGASPWAVIKEAVNRLDDRLEVQDFAPTMQPSPVPNAKPKPGGGTSNQATTGQQMPGSQPMPGTAQ